jgi:hypothetical protein
VAVAKSMVWEMQPETRQRGSMASTTTWVPNQASGVPQRPL